MPDRSASFALLDCAETDGQLLLSAAQLDFSRAVPSCPDWDAADLVRHMGVILNWMETIVRTRHRVSRRDLRPAPAELDELGPWYRTQLEGTLTVLGSADPDSECWTFAASGEQRVWWWWRRLAVEIAVHRWDAERAAALTPTPVDGQVAAAGIEEFMTEFLPGLLTRTQLSGLTGTLHLHANDGPTEWWIDLADPGTAVPEHRKGDTAVRGSRSDLLLWLNNREPNQPLDVVGPSTVVQSWSQLTI